jgi:hypothetical protein
VSTRLAHLMAANYAVYAFPPSLHPRGDGSEEDNINNDATQRQANDPPPATLVTDAAALHGRYAQGSKRPRFSAYTEGQRSTPSGNEDRPQRRSPLVIQLQGSNNKFQAHLFRGVGPGVSRVANTKSASLIRDRTISLP